MSGKKGKKTKGKTMPLQDFLGDAPGSISTVPKPKSSWADCTEDDEDYGYSSRPREPVVLPTAPRAARDLSINEENIPTSPPYTAYISNLPYDVEEEDLYEFFQDMNVSGMRLPKDANKFKGYGYVDFKDRQSLIDALSMPDTTLKSRRVRIEVSNHTNDDRRGRMGRMGEGRRDYGDDPERTTGDWRSARAAGAGEEGGGGGGGGGPPSGEDRFRSRGGGGFGSRDDNRDRDSGFEDNKPGNWRDAPRGEPAGGRDMERPRPSYRDSRGPGGPGEERGETRDWNRFADRGRGPRDGSRERDGERGGGGGSSFGPRRTYGDDADRDRSDRERWGSLRSQPREPVDGPPSASDDASRTRPKLALQPRSKPVDPAAPKDDIIAGPGDGDEDAPAAADEPAPVVPAGEEEEEAGEQRQQTPQPRVEREREMIQQQPRVEREEPRQQPRVEREEPRQQPRPTPTHVPSTNIFGAARPVDTAAREREIEERLAKSAEARKEEGDDKRGGPRDGVWGRRNGEGRDDQERSRPAWRSGPRPDERDLRDNNRERREFRDNRDQRESRDSRDTRDGQEPRGDSRGPPPSRGGPTPPARGPPRQIDSRPPPDGAEREKKQDFEDEEINRMPKAKDDHAPNFAASNKYSMLPDDVDPDNVEE